MIKNKPVLILGAGVVIALVVAIISYGYLQKRTAVQVQSVDTQPLVVAAVDMPWGEVLATSTVKLQPYLKATLPPGSFSEPGQVVGRTLLYPVVIGEPILESKLAPKTAAAGGVGAIITPKKRAMAVRVDKVIGVSGFIRPGSRVDVLVTIAQKTGDSGPMTKIVLENILVLAVGSEMEKGTKQEKPTVVDVLTMEVTPEEGEKLALAATEGKLQMALRNSTDSDGVSTRGTTIPALLSSYSGPAAPPKAQKVAAKPGSSRPAPSQTPPPRPATFSVELIKGTSVSTHKFERGE
jgi:pilus assembly protein CpaB